MEQKPTAWKSWLAAAVLTQALCAVGPGAHAQVNSKWITVVLSGEPTELDGCQSSRQVQGRIIKQNIFETLIERDASDFSLKPRLATSWQRLDDNNWRFELRKGVFFHDGTPLDSAVVKRSLERTATSTALGCGDAAKAFNDLQIEVTTPDAQTVQIKTSRPEPIMLMKMASVAIVPPSVVWDKHSLVPVGTGPYVFDHWTAGQEIVMKRNEKYWGVKPQAEGVRFIWRSETSVRAAMVKLGEADIAVAISQGDATDPELDYAQLTSDTLALRIDAVTPPLNDRRVRLAMDYAIDRVAVMNALLPKGTLYASQLVVPAIPGHNHELDKNRRPYDPAKSKQLLAEAKADGVPVDKEIVMIGYPESFPSANEQMEAYRAMLIAVGFNMKLQNTETGQYAKWNRKPYPDPRPPYIIQSLHDNINGDPAFTVYNKYGCGGGSSGYCNPDFDKQVEAALSLSGDARVAAWSRIFQVLYDEVPDVVLFHMVGFTRISKRLNFVPDVTTHNEIRYQEITFK